MLKCTREQDSFLSFSFFPAVYMIRFRNTPPVFFGMNVPGCVLVDGGAASLVCLAIALMHSIV